MTVNERKAQLVQLLERLKKSYSQLTLQKLDYQTLMNESYGGNLTDIYILTKMKIYKQYGRFYRYRPSYKNSTLRVYFDMICNARNHLQRMEDTLMALEQRMYNINQQIWS